MEDESYYTSQFVPRFLNEEPVVLAGLTLSELSASIAVGFSLAILTTSLAAIFVSGLGSFLVLFFVVGAAVGGSVSSKMIRKSKVGKPRGFLSARMKVFGSKFLPKIFNGNNMYLADKTLTIGRTKRLLVKVID